MRFREVLEALTPSGLANNSVLSQVMGVLNTADSDTADTSTPAKSSSTGAGADVSAIQDPDFNKKLQKVADALGVEKSALVKIMQRESRMDPKAINPKSGASGLIQFMPKTAQNLGTSIEAIRKMSGVEQLDLVYQYYKMVGVRPGMGVEDLYMATFMPAAVGKSDDTVLGQSGAGGFSGAVYAQNAGMDRKGKGTITVADVKNFVRSA